MSICSTSQTPSARSPGSVCSPPPSLTSSQTLNMLDLAAEQMMVHRDFQAAFDTCDRGLQSFSNMEPEDNRWRRVTSQLHFFFIFTCWGCWVSVFCPCRHGEVKAGFCILGIQALAELNRWHGVLSWVLQHYERLENIPAKIMQLWWGELRLWMFLFIHLSHLIFIEYVKTVDIFCARQPQKCSYDNLQ